MYAQWKIDNGLQEVDKVWVHNHDSATTGSERCDGAKAYDRSVLPAQLRENRDRLCWWSHISRWSTRIQIHEVDLTLLQRLQFPAQYVFLVVLKLHFGLCFRGQKCLVVVLLLRLGHWCAGLVKLLGRRAAKLTCRRLMVKSVVAELRRKNVYVRGSWARKRLQYSIQWERVSMLS